MMVHTPLAHLDVEPTGSRAEIERTARLLASNGQQTPVKIRGRKIVRGKVLVAAAASLGWMFIETEDAA